MTPEETEKKLAEYRLVPVVVLNRAESAPPLAQACLDGGLPCLEITLRSDCALDAIREAKKTNGVLVGAGTVLTAEQCGAAAEAGADFIVSPGFDDEVLRESKRRNLLYLPGCVTPTEIQRARAAGLRSFKFFPASCFGGIKTLKAYASVFQDMTAMPTGGVNAENLAEFLSLKNVMACGGSWLATGEMIESGRFDAIQNNVSAAVETIRKL